MIIVDKTIVQINMMNFSSTGSIMLNIHKAATEAGMKSFTACANYSKCKERGVNGQLLIGNYIERNLEIQFDKYTGYYSCLNYFGTRQFLKKLDRIRPDIIHLHNIHGGFINIALLFDYIKRKHIKTVWTFHDCWPFTGYCPYFDMVECYKWIDGCHHCQNLNRYPVTLVDRTNEMWSKKKDIFTGVEYLQIVTPSAWLQKLVGQSFLKEYPVKVINNGIDLDIFKPRKSNFRERYNCKNKFLILGVAFDWSPRKGVDTFKMLAEDLSDDFEIIMIGVTEALAKKLPERIIKIERTNNQIELAEIYTAVDLMINPTLEDNYPTVNMEAIACGTPVITYASGGSSEMINNQTGIVVEKNNYNRLKNEINSVYIKRQFSSDICVQNAVMFNANDKYSEYIQLYQQILKSE